MKNIKKIKARSPISIPPDSNSVRSFSVLPTENTKERLVIGKLIGQGGMSNIEEVYDLNLLRTAARKVVKPEMSGEEPEMARLIEEAQVTAQLGHPNIVPVYELGVDDAGQIFFTMKKVTGRTFTEILSEKNPEDRTERDLFEYLQIFIKICDAVAFAHSKGVIHRDIKPDNVMVGEFGEVYLMDWGFAQLKEQWTPSEDEVRDIGMHRQRYTLGETRNNVTATLYYMPPEAALGIPSEMDERSDIFCLGGILYKILTLKPPFSGTSIQSLVRRVVICQIPSPEDAVEIDLPSRLTRICMKALKHRKSDRYQTANELKEDVERFLQSGWQFQRKQFDEGDTIVKEGDPGDEAYVITTGSCRVFKKKGNKKIELGQLGVGDVFGEISVFANNPRSASVECTDKTTVMVITRKNFEDDLGMSFWLGLFAKALADRFMESQERISELEQELEKYTK